MDPFGNLTNLASDTFVKPFTSSSTSGNMNPYLKYGLILLAIIAICVVIYMIFFRKREEATVIGPFVLNGIGAAGSNSGKVTIFDQSQITSSLGNNWTLSFFLYEDDAARERITIGGPEGEFRFKTFLYILGVGEVIFDPIHQKMRVSMRALAKPDLQNDAKIHIDVPNVMVARWNQITITMEGRSVDVYLNGSLASSAIMENLPAISPVGLLMEGSPDFSGQAGLFQAWPYRRNAEQIMNNYKRNTDLRGKPHIPDSLPKSIWPDIRKSLCDIGFCGFRFKTGPLDYVDYEFA